MAVPLSLRLDAELKKELARQADIEGVTITALVSRLLEHGLAQVAHPGIVFRPGPSGWRAGLAGGPDVDEVVRAARDAGALSEDAIAAAAASLGIHPRLAEIAFDYAAEHVDEIEGRLRANDEAAERVRARAAGRASLLAG